MVFTQTNEDLNLITGSRIYLYCSVTIGFVWNLLAFTGRQIPFLQAETTKIQINPLIRTVWYSLPESMASFIGFVSNMMV